MATASPHIPDTASADELSALRLAAQNDDKLQLALTKFERIMELRAGMYQRLASRVRTVVRWGMVGLVFLTIGLLVLMALLTVQINEASQTSGQMADEVRLLSQEMGRIRVSVRQMRQAMASMPRIATSVHAIGSTTADMNQHVQHMHQDVAEVERRMAALQGRVRNMGVAVRHMRGDVGGMRRNVGHMAKPIP